jgi:hypothetical protein
MLAVVELLPPAADAVLGSGRQRWATQQQSLAWRPPCPAWSSAQCSSPMQLLAGGSNLQHQHQETRVVQLMPLPRASLLRWL